MSKQLYILTKEWSRHGIYSGYQRLISFGAKPLKITKGFFMPYRIGHFFKSKSKLVNYKTETVSKELSLLFKLFRKKTIHVLYGDMDYYYLRYMKCFPFNLRKNTLIATFHHPPYELEKRLHYNRSKVLGALDKIIVMGPNQIPFLQQYTNAKFKFIPHGINTDYFTYNLNQERLNQILLIGVSHRDHDRNIKIINEVNKRINTNFVVIITEEYAKIYKNIKNVDVVTENISDTALLNYYQQSKALLLSLKECTASNSILEALACGCPIVTNNVGAIRYYITEECKVPVFENSDIIGSVDYIIKLVSDASYLKDISLLQRNLAEKYDWKYIAKTTEDFIFS